MKIAVIYKSFLGTTKKYAHWIAEKYHADLYGFEVTEEQLKAYDLIIIASGTYAAMMPLTKFVKNNWHILSEKKVIVLAVGMAPPEDPQSVAQFELIPAHIQQEIFYFKLPGKLFKAGPGGEPSQEKLEPVYKKIEELQQEV